MRYIFYADVYFIQNFILKVAVLYLAMYCGKMHFEILRGKGIIKICIASFCGTIIEIMGLLFGSSYNVFVICVHLFEVPLMSWYVLGKNCRQIIRVIISGYFFTILINGVLEALWNQFGVQGGYIFYLLFSSGAVIVGVRIWYNYQKIQKGIFDVELIHEQKSLRIKGFYDSGNILKDAHSQKGVHIISGEILKYFEMEFPVLVPYQSLGKETGLLEVYYIDELIVEGEKQKISIKNCPLGVTKDNLLEGKNYQIILNEEVF